MDENTRRDEEAKLAGRVSLFKEVSAEDAATEEAVTIMASAELTDSRFHRQVFYAALFLHEEVNSLHTRLYREEKSYKALPLSVKIERLEEELPEMIKGAKSKVRSVTNIVDALKLIS